MGDEAEQKGKEGADTAEALRVKIIGLTASLGVRAAQVAWLQRELRRIYITSREKIDDLREGETELDRYKERLGILRHAAAHVLNELDVENGAEEAPVFSRDLLYDFMQALAGLQELTTRLSAAAPEYKACLAVLQAADKLNWIEPVEQNSASGEESKEGNG